MRKHSFALCLCLGLICFFNHANAWVPDLADYAECSPALTTEVCGFTTNTGEPYSDATCLYTPGVAASEFCNCTAKDFVFYYGAGCFCPNGYYNDIYAGPDAFTCQKCPEEYPLSDGYDESTESFGNANSMEDACYRTYKIELETITLTLQFYMIDEESGYDPYVIYAECKPGYWTETNYNETGYYYYGNDEEIYCDEVGTDYYSSGYNSRKQCPPYTNASGASVPGQTDGYGTGADDISDCKIPETEIFNNASGAWKYHGGCGNSG